MNKKTTSQHLTDHKNSNRLKNTLLANGIFSGVSGLILIVMSKLVGNLLGTIDYFPAWGLPFIGVNLAIFGSILYFIAMQQPISKAWVKLIIALDVSWVIGSLIIITLFQSLLNSIAPVIILSIAAIVASFAYLQWRYLLPRD